MCVALEIDKVSRANASLFTVVVDAASFHGGLSTGPKTLEGKRWQLQGL